MEMNGISMSFYEAFNDKNKHPTAWYQSKEAMPPHYHNSLEFVAVLDGSADIMVNGQRATLLPGQIMIAASLAPHSIYSIGTGGRFLCVLLPRESIGEWNDRLENSTFANIYIDDSYGVIELMMLMERIMKNIIFGDDTRAFISEMRLIGSAVAGLVIKCSTLVNRRSMSNTVAAAVELINLKYREKLRLSDVSNELLCNSQVLSLQFRETMGMSVNDYINSLRAYEFKRILTEEKSLNLDEAAYRAGFQSMRSAYRCFERFFGSTPGKMNSSKRDHKGKESSS